MVLVVVALASVLAAELLLQLPFVVCMRDVVSTSTRAGAILRNRSLSDDVKERLLPRYALRIMRQSTLMFLLMLTAVSPFILLSLVWGEPFTSELSRWPVVVGTTILATAYVSLRRAALWRTTP